MIKPVIVDTNILFSALLSGEKSFFIKVIRKSSRQFMVNELVLTELFKHKERIIQSSKLTNEEVLALFYDMMQELDLFKEDFVSEENRRKAYQLCKDIDETDTPHIAITLELDGLFWTGDKKLIKGLKQKGFDHFYNPKKDDHFHEII